MIPFLPDPSAAPGPAVSTPLTNPGAAARQGGVGLDFAKMLGTELPGAEPAGQAGASPAEPQPPTPLAIRLPSGTILPERGAPLPQPAALTVDAGGDGPLTDARTKTPIPGTAAPEPAASPAPDPAALLPVVAGQITADVADDTETAPEDTPEPDGAAPSDRPVALLAALLPMPAVVVVPATLTSANPANPPAPGSARLAARLMAHPAAPPAQPDVAPMPDPSAVPEAADDAAPAPAVLLAESATASSSPTTSAPAPQAAAAVVPASPAASVADRAEPRAPAPQQDSAIAQVGELREALRAARPEMTVRHAEFGFVSLRVEAVGAQDWRAVLASRDPGFVPAIQTALADRAVAATTDAATANAGQNGTGQNSPGDQRYGSSPNGGQGSSQPYLGQSHGRGEGSSSQSGQRQPSTTNAVATRAGEADADRGVPRDRGVFA